MWFGELGRGEREKKREREKGARARWGTARRQNPPPPPPPPPRRTSLSPSSFPRSPNDAFVTKSWSDALGADGKATFLADPHLHLARALDQVTVTTVDALGGPRAKRFSLVVDKGGKLAVANWEPDSGTGLTCSRAGPDLVAAVKAAAGK